MATAEQWLGKIARLRVAQPGKNPAPHKPLLLPVVLEMAGKDPSFGEVLALTPELAFRFCTYWSIVAHLRKQAPDVRFPFFHLKTDGFWSPLAEDGKPAPDGRLARYAALPRDFVALVKAPAHRAQASRLLIAR
jgi:predicted restriction endonuclease